MASDKVLGLFQAITVHLCFEPGYNLILDCHLQLLILFAVAVCKHMEAQHFLRHVLLCRFHLSTDRLRTPDTGSQHRRKDDSRNCHHPFSFSLRHHPNFPPVTFI